MHATKIYYSEPLCYAMLPFWPMYITHNVTKLCQKHLMLLQQWLNDCRLRYSCSCCTTRQHTPGVSGQRKFIQNIEQLVWHFLCIPINAAIEQPVIIHVRIFGIFYWLSVLPWFSHTGSWCWSESCCCFQDKFACCWNPAQCQRASAGKGHLYIWQR